MSTERLLGVLNAYASIDKDNISELLNMVILYSDELDSIYKWDESEGYVEPYKLINKLNGYIYNELKRNKYECEWVNKYNGVLSNNYIVITIPHEKVEDKGLRLMLCFNKNRLELNTYHDSGILKPFGYVPIDYTIKGKNFGRNKDLSKEDYKYIKSISSDYRLEVSELCTELRLTTLKDLDDLVQDIVYKLNMRYSLYLYYINNFKIKDIEDFYLKDNIEKSIRIEKTR